MSKSVLNYLIVSLTFIFLLTGCRKKEFDEFYGRPENLGDPIYQQLQQKGNFTKFLDAIDKSGYKETLSASGSWTVFAPTDAAFAKFMTDNNITTITPELAASIVRYSMTYDGEKVERLSDFFSNKGFIKNTAFRRRTVYYDFVYDAVDANGNPIKAIASNRNGSFINTDFNNKNVPYYLTPFMTFASLTAADYNYFYPGSTYTGRNVGPASIIDGQYNISAENGVIHVIDRVLTPPLSIDQYVGSKSEYSVFKSLLDRFVTYSLNTDVSHRYEVLSGKPGNVYVKNYATLLSFSPNNENYLRVDANDAQNGSYSIFAPTNEAVNAYAKSTLLKYWGKRGVKTLNELYVVAPDLIRDFVNSHLFTTTVWPSKFNTTLNALNDASKLSPTNVVDKQALSNGFLYGVNKAQDASVFSTVYGNVNLDPDYFIMKQALNFFGLTFPIKTASLNYAVVMIPDATLKKMGFYYDAFFPSAPIRGDNAALKRILQAHIIPLGDRNPNFATGSGILETSNGEYIKYANGKLSSSGTSDSTLVAKQTIPVDSVNTAVNGVAVYGKEALTPTPLQIARHIERYGTLVTDPYYDFYQYLKTSQIYNATSGAINGVSDGVFYTVLIPTKAAIVQAVKDGLLPGNSTTGVPTYNPTDFIGINQVSRFIQYHIINKTAIASDGQKTGSYETLYKDDNGNTSLVRVTTNTTSSLIFTDVTNRTANALLGPSDRSNVLSNRAVIHQINNYLKYQF
ncbi:fasciclin domain-containing protein [Pedobacter frigiditerrae]|uniref:fasciclin domain-containing protein n=1 Tax=Pedobacter frigiditerrae TaxID=2530452 RepID=UPI00292FE3ED|nr:fasciclin domain-containing protein [Pedobacter frigiditerrae]